MPKQTKEIIISTKMDMSELDRQMNQLERKLSNMRGFQEGMQGTQSAAQVMRERGETRLADRVDELQKKSSIKTHQQLSSLMGQEVSSIKESIKLLEQKKKMLESLSRGSEQYKAALRDIKTLEGDISKAGTRASMIQGEMDMMPGRDDYSGFGGMMRGGRRLATAYRHGGLAGARKAASRMGITATGVLGAVGGAVTAAGGVLATGANIAGRAYEMAAEYPIRSLETRAARQQLGSRETIDQINASDRQFEDLFFAQEKRAAMEDAAKYYDKQYTGGKLRAAGSAGTSALGYGALGAGIGSIIPGVGTMIGGGLGMAFGAAKSVLGDQKSFSALFDEEEYRNIIGKQSLEAYRRSEAARIAQDPTRAAGFRRFNKERGQYLQLSRELGLSDEAMFGQGQTPTDEYDSLSRRANYRQGFIRSGDGEFTINRQMQAANRILGAGGSARFIGEGQGAYLANQMERAGLTNAAGNLGKISAIEGGEGTSEQAKRMWSEIFSAGIDDSEFRQEQKVFVQATTQMFERMGGGGGDMATRLARLLEGTGDRTKRGIEAGTAAMGAMENVFGAEAGLEGIYKAAGLFNTSEGQELIGNLDPLQQIMAQGLTPNEMTADNPLVKYMAEQAGMDAGDFVDKFRKVAFGSVQGTGVSAERGKDIATKLRTGQIEEGRTREQMEGELIAELRQKRPDLVKGKSFQEQKAIAQEYFQMDMSLNSQEDKARIEGNKRKFETRIEEGPTNLVERMEKQKAQAEQFTYGDRMATDLGKEIKDMANRDMTKERAEQQTQVSEFIKQMENGPAAVEGFLRALQGAADRMNNTDIGGNSPTYNPSQGYNMSGAGAPRSGGYSDAYNRGMTNSLKKKQRTMGTPKSR